MHDWLVLDLTAPLMSFGGVAVDHVGPVRDFPALSMVTGLLGNAMGWDWADRAAHQGLQDRIVMASALARAGQRITDTQNAQLSRQDRGWTTRGEAEGRGGASYDAPHRRLRDYHADSAVIIVLRLDPVTDEPTLDALAKALAAPARPLFLGRKPCLPSRPILRPGTVQAETSTDALQKVASRKEPGMSRLPANAVAQWSPGQGPDGRAEHLADVRVWETGLHGGTRPVITGRIGEGQA